MQCKRLSNVKWGDLSPRLLLTESPIRYACKYTENSIQLTGNSSRAGGRGEIFDGKRYSEMARTSTYRKGKCEYSRLESEREKGKVLIYE